MTEGQVASFRIDVTGSANQPRRRSHFASQVRNGGSRVVSHLESHFG
jgi:hypothetical protein